MQEKLFNYSSFKIQNYLIWERTIAEQFVLESSDHEVTCRGVELHWNEISLERVLAGKGFIVGIKRRRGTSCLSTNLYGMSYRAIGIHHVDSSRDQSFGFPHQQCIPLLRLGTSVGKSQLLLPSLLLIVSSSGLKQNYSDHIIHNLSC